MNVDWKPGDRALCVADYTELTPPYHAPDGPPRKGTIYLVHMVVPWHPSMGGAGLLFQSPRIFMQDYFFIREGCWACKDFKKIVPACDRIEGEKSNSQCQP